MKELAHIPVLAEEVLHYLTPESGKLYCDGTLGGGGHTRLILERSSPDGRVIAIDRDPVALAMGSSAVAEFSERAHFVQGRFAHIDTILQDNAEALGVTESAGCLDGLLIDIGPSSMQFDDAPRGFSFQQEGPIDMRMNQSQGRSAHELLRRLSAPELSRILRDYGEERYSRGIAEKMKEAVRTGWLQTTTQLADLVESAIPAAAKRRMKIHPATKTFQALRIAVNEELDDLARFLQVFPDLLAPGGRCAVISFHSLEDRLVKRRFRDLAWSSSLPPELARQAGERITPICRPITRKPVFASDAEIGRNPRARSARLRVCEKVDPHS